MMQFARNFCLPLIFVESLDKEGPSFVNFTHFWVFYKKGSRVFMIFLWQVTINANGHSKYVYFCR